jgi:hypothetical protein
LGAGSRELVIGGSLLVAGVGWGVVSGKKWVRPHHEADPSRRNPMSGAEKEKLRWLGGAFSIFLLLSSEYQTGRIKLPNIFGLVGL